MAPLETLAIHWCKQRFIGAIGVIEANGNNGAISNIANPMVQMAIDCVIDAIGVNYVNGTNDSSDVIDFNMQWKAHRTSPFGRHIAIQ